MAIDIEQIKKGVEVEMEHTSDKKVALKIALDHLKEDPKYYDKLMAAGLEELNNVKNKKQISPEVQAFVNECDRLIKILRNDDLFEKQKSLVMMEELHEGEFCPQCLIEYILEHKDMLLEAEYKGRKVPLGKPMAGDVAKFKVFVKNKKGNVVKVNFGQKGVKIKKNNPKRRKSFRARHKCHTAKDRTTARYWSCRKW